MLTILLWSLLAVLAVAVMLQRSKSSRIRKMALQFTGPRPLPLLGNMHQFVDIPPTCQGVFRGGVKFTTTYGDLSRAWIGPFFNVLASGNDTLEAIYGSTKVLKKSFNYFFLHPWLGTGLLTAEGEKWRKSRKVLTPAFHFKILEQFVEVFDRNGRVFVDILKSREEKREFDIQPYITRVTLDIICETAMGVTFNAQKDTDSEYIRAVHAVANCTVRRGLSPWLYSDFLYNLTPSYRLFKRSIKIMHETTYEVIRKRKAELQKRQHGEEDSIVEGVKPKLAFLDLLLQYSQEGAGLSDKDIREEVDTFMFEGHDTTSSAISFAIYCLAHHPDVQDKAVKELQDMFGSSDRPMTYQDLQEMKYLEMVIKETLRMFPSVPLIGRELTEDFPIGDKILPKETNVHTYIYTLHRKEENFPEPHKFNPERFLPENIQDRHPYCYIPFSAGPRNCIGQKFAMLEIKSTLSKLLLAFKILPVDERFEDHEQMLSFELILRSVKGIKIVLEPRKL